MLSCQDEALLGNRILVAEDDWIIAYDTQTLLQNAGADVAGPVATLAATLALARSDALSCAVLDINLRDEDVLPAAQVLKERGVNIVFYTAHWEPESLMRYWPDARLVAKPAPHEVLMNAVRAACQRGARQP